MRERQTVSGDASLPENVERMVSPIGIDPLSAGADREVFEITIGDYEGDVLKIDADGSVNKREFQTWETAPEELRKHLCPIKYISDDYTRLVMEQVDDAEIRHADYPPSLEKFEEKFRDAGVSVRDLDAGDNNIGLLSEVKVLYDYPYGRL